MNHPYKSLPSKAFWSRSVARNFLPSEVYEGKFPLLEQASKVASAGSCFAANLVPYLETRGFVYVKTEQVTRAARVPEQDLSYDKFSAAYGNLYTPRQLRQLIERSVGRFKPEEDRWHIGDNMVIDPFRPGLSYPA